MGRRKNVESPQEENENLHEMETQRIDISDEVEGSPSSLIISSPVLEAEGRRVTRRSLLEANTPKLEGGRKVNGRKKFVRTTRVSKAAEKSLEDEIVEKAKLKSKDKRSLKKDGVETTPKKEITSEQQVEEKVNDEGNVPLADFMASLNASPTSAFSKDKAEHTKVDGVSEPSALSEQLPPAEKDSTGAPVETSGKLRSSAADAEENVLAKSYRKTLRETEEYALNFISKEFHHPVITCFRELNKGDISSIVGNSKLKKSCNNLEQSIVYLGLIDLLATVNNNPVYGESDSTKMSKNVSNVVQKILLEFKNILGTWALSGNEQLSNRYSQIINYLRVLVPMFKKAGFDEGFSNILDCIEKEVTRHKQNQEKIKSMSTTSRAFEKTQSSTEEQGENRLALNEIILNVELNVKLDDSDDDEDPVVLKEDKTLKIFGKPLKGSPRLSNPVKKRIKKAKAGLDLLSSHHVKSPTTQLRQTNDKTPKSHSSAKKATLPAPKTLAKVFQSPGLQSPKSSSVQTSENVTGKTPPVKRNASEDVVSLNDATKKRRIEDGSIKGSNNEPKSSIKSFFQSMSSPSSVSSSANVEKPTVNAFALMMNRSREMAQQKKVDKSNKIPMPSLKVNAVKS